jgi:hypothetical protein
MQCSLGINNVQMFLEILIGLDPRNHFKHSGMTLLKSTSYLDDPLVHNRHTISDTNHSPCGTIYLLYDLSTTTYDARNGGVWHHCAN